MLREAVVAGTALGREAKRHMDSGGLVPDDVIIGLVAERLARPDARKGFVLDGYPRTAAQARALDDLLEERGLTLDRVVLFRIGEADLVARLTGRRVCRGCGRNYHVTFSPPAKPGVCDACRGDVCQRSDDGEQTVRRRIQVYEENTRPLVEYYRERGLLDEVDAGGTVPRVSEAVVAAVEGGR
jgi:adenylate kinase